MTSADSGATGVMTLTINVTRDSASAITAVTSSEFVVTMNGFPANTVLTGAHIHPGAAGATGGIAINTGLANGEITLGNGSGSFTKSPSTPITVEQAQNLANTPQNFYFNVHTQLNTGGAIRAGSYSINGSEAPESGYSHRYRQGYPAGFDGRTGLRRNPWNLIRLRPAKGARCPPHSPPDFGASDA